MKKIKQLEPMEIEKRSFEIISHELSEMQITLPDDQEMITKRVIHTSADFDYIQTLKYSKDAVAIAKRLISEGADIVTDTNMALSGINKKYLAKFGGQAHCFMADDEVALIAKEKKTTRAAVSTIPISAKLSTTEKLPTTTYTSHKWHRKCATGSWAK